MTGTTSAAGAERSVLQEALQDARDSVLRAVGGVGEYDLRRPMTPTGTNLLGIVKHLASVQYGYLGDVFGSPSPERMAWIDDGSVWEGADMWATPDESSDYIIGLYRRSSEHGDRTIAEHDLGDIGIVSWWHEGAQQLTLRGAIVRMISETAQHAGHADITRELIDGFAGDDHDSIGDDAHWQRYVARISDAAATFQDDRRAP